MGVLPWLYHPITNPIKNFPTQPPTTSLQFLHHPHPRKRQITRHHTTRTPSPTRPSSRIEPLLRVPPTVQDHNIRRSRGDTVPIQPPRSIGDPRLVLDAVGAADRRGAIIARADLAMEEGPECGAVEEEVGAAVDVLREAHAARLIAAPAPREVRVAVPAVCDPGARSVLLRAGALPVRRFGLLHARIDIFRVVQVVIVESVVFEGGAGEPGCLCGFDEHTAARGDVLMTAAFE